MTRTDAYAMGRIAYASGVTSDANPYQMATHGASAETSSRRTAWYTGYYDEWRWQRHGPNGNEKYCPLVVCDCDVE